MQRDHRLGFPAALLADTPASNTARYPLGRPKRDPEPQTWPFPMVPKTVFVPDSRTPDSDKPQPVVLGVDLGEPGGDETVITLRRGIEVTSGPVINIAPGCFGVWRKTPPPIGIEVKMLYRGATWGPCKWDGHQWADGWEWFDTSAETEKPAKAEPQADAEVWIAHDGGPCPQRVKDAHAAGARIMVRFRSGNEVVTMADTGALDRVFENIKTPGWRHLDVLAYRVVPA